MNKRKCGIDISVTIAKHWIFLQYIHLKTVTISNKTNTLYSVR